MKLHQNLLLCKDLGIETMLSSSQLLLPNLRSLIGPYDFSFHPYLVMTYAEHELDLLQESKSLLEFRLDLLINDDEHHKPIFDSISQNRSLLLIAEFNSCLNEALSTLGLSILSLVNKNLRLSISLKTLLPFSYQQFIGAVMIVLNSVDSLLFLRGLALSQVEIEFFKPIDSRINFILKNMVAKFYV